MKHARLCVMCFTKKQNQKQNNKKHKQKPYLILMTILWDSR